MHKLIALFSGAILLALSFNPALAGQSSFALAPSAGTASAQTITVPGVSSLSDMRGTDITWIVGAGLTDTGPTTISVSGLAAVSVDRMNSGTHMPLGGGEMPAGEMVRAYFDGTELILETYYTGSDPVGSSKIINYTTPDPGYVLENGQCLSQTGEPALFGKYGTQYNTQDTCPAGQFGVDNKAGRTVAAADTLTVSGSAAGILSNCASTIGATCGVQSSVVAQANLANFTLPSSASASTSSFASVSDPGHSHVQNGSSATVGAENNDNVNPLNGGTSNTRSAVTGISVSVSSSTSVGTTVTSGGSATPLSLVQPTKIVIFEAKL